MDFEAMKRWHAHAKMNSTNFSHRQKQSASKSIASKIDGEGRERKMWIYIFFMKALELCFLQVLSVSQERIIHVFFQPWTLLSRFQILLIYAGFVSTNISIWTYKKMFKEVAKPSKPRRLLPRPSEPSLDALSRLYYNKARLELRQNDF